MQSNTRKALIARLASAALLLAVPFAVEAADLVQGYFQLPSAQVIVTDARTDPNTFTVVNSLNLMNPFCGPNEVRSATADKGVGFASAQAGKGYGHFAMAGSTEEGGATGTAGLWVNIKDQENRPLVKLNMTIKGFASAPDPVVASSGASYQVYVADALTATPRAWLYPDGCTVYSAQWIGDVLLTPLIYALSAFDQKELDLYGNVQARSGLKIYRYGELIDTTVQSYEPRTVTLEVAPNESFVVVVTASTGGGGLAVVDPIIAAHPDNPDVQIEITGVPDQDTGLHPLDGFAAADLQALGIDPQPFINLGFLAPSDQPPSPPPPPQSKDWCGPGFWLNNATNSGGSAWPASAYHDYSSTAGQLAGCPAATGNPTLLDVLKNASLYFATQKKGAGFNCVADYLSRASGLLGTSVDNDGVCSIDQYGRHIE